MIGYLYNYLVNFMTSPNHPPQPPPQPPPPFNAPPQPNGDPWASVDPAFFNLDSKAANPYGNTRVHINQPDRRPGTKNPTLIDGTPLLPDPLTRGERDVGPVGSTDLRTTRGRAAHIAERDNYRQPISEHVRNLGGVGLRLMGIGRPPGARPRGMVRSAIEFVPGAALTAIGSLGWVATQAIRPFSNRSRHGIWSRQRVTPRGPHDPSPQHRTRRN